MRNPIKVKLGSKNGFWHDEDVNKEYTEILEDRMPHLVLKELLDLKTQFPGNVTGFCGKDKLSRMLMRSDIADELKFDNFGYQVSLDMMLKDLKKGKLIEGYVGKSNWATVKITDLGIEFLKNNVIEG